RNDAGHVQSRWVRYRSNPLLGQRSPCSARSLGRCEPWGSPVLRRGVRPPSEQLGPSRPGRRTMSARTRAAAPIAVRMGLTHVSVAEASCGWVALAWSGPAGPYAISPIVGLPEAEDQARAYASLASDRVLDLPDWRGIPDGVGLIHVDRREDGAIE